MHNTRMTPSAEFDAMKEDFIYFIILDIDKIDDPVERNAVISFIDNFGQMPKQVNAQDHVFLSICICT